ncbi:MAG: HlyD family efflux transporter periplasmic adaptor subunit [Bacteroidota bacterium]
MSKKKQAALALGILGVAVAGSVLMVQLRPDPPTQPPPPQTPLVETVPAEVRSGALAVEGAGTVRAADIAAVASQVSGRVVYVAPQLVSGGRVAAGQVLLRIDPADFQNRVQQARADVASQDVAVLQAQEEATLARREYEQFEERRAARAASAYGGVDDDDYAARVLPPRGEAIDRVPQQDPPPDGPSPLALRQPQLDAARAARQRAGAALNDAQLALSRTVVRAPFAGLVQSETIAVGDVVQVGAPFAQLIAAREVEAVVPLSDDEAGLVPDLFSGGATALVTADFGGVRYGWRATVDRVEATRDQTARTINVVLRVPSPISGGRPVDPGEGERASEPTVILTAPPPLLPGTYVQAEIDGAELDRFVVVPRRALRRDDRVWTVTRDSILSVVPVGVLQQVGEDVYLDAPALADGARIVTNDLQGVVDGMTVRLASRERQRGRSGDGDDSGGDDTGGSGAGNGEAQAANTPRDR